MYLIYLQKHVNPRQADVFSVLSQIDPHRSSIWIGKAHPDFSVKIRAYSAEALINNTISLHNFEVQSMKLLTHGDYFQIISVINYFHFFINFY